MNNWLMSVLINGWSKCVDGGPNVLMVVYIKELFARYGFNQRRRQGLRADREA